MKIIFIIIGFIIVFIGIVIGFMNTILQLIGSVFGYVIWIAYFFAIGIIYEIIARIYRFFKKRKN
jgi:hypothetical protein